MRGVIDDGLGSLGASERQKSGSCRCCRRRRRMSQLLDCTKKTIGVERRESAVGSPSHARPLWYSTFRLKRDAAEGRRRRAPFPHLLGDDAEAAVTQLACLSVCRGGSNPFQLLAQTRVTDPPQLPQVASRRGRESGRHRGDWRVSRLTEVAAADAAVVRLPCRRSVAAWQGGSGCGTAV